jgi:hypothetical protein
MVEVDSSEWLIREIRKRRITRLCHFTSIRALERIVEDQAIHDRKTLEGRETRYIFNDPARYDGRRGHICLSIEHPNVYMMASQQERRQREFVVLCIQPSEMARTGVLFSRLNAASESGALLTAGEQGFKDLYVRQPGPRPIFRGDTHAQSCPTDIQAEVLIPGSIPFSSILGVVMSSDENVDYVRHVLSSQVPTRPVVCQSDFFSSEKIVSAIRSGTVIDLPGL